MTKDKIFWDKIAYKYAKDPIADQTSYEVKLAKTQEYLTPQSKVLEFGCGTGTTALIHAPHVKHILATDLSENMLKIAKSKAETAAITNITFQQCDITEFDAPEESYDAVMAMSILHLLQDKEAVIAKVFKWLKPGSVFISSTACLRDMNILIPLALPLAKLVGKAPQTIGYFSQTDLVHSIKDCGFTIEHQWCPKKGAAVFIVAKKSNQPSG